MAEMTVSLSIDTSEIRALFAELDAAAEHPGMTAARKEELIAMLSAAPDEKIVVIDDADGVMRAIPGAALEDVARKAREWTA